MFSVLFKKDLMADLLNYTCDVFFQNLISEKSRVDRKHLEECIKEPCVELKLGKRKGKGTI